MSGLKNLIRPQMRNLFAPFGQFSRNDFLDVLDNGYEETVPSVNIRESSDAYRIELAVPGMKKEDFNITVSSRIVRISCEKEQENKETEHGYARKEYDYSYFSRSFTLPANTSEEDIKAQYKDGILSLEIPKTEDKQGGNGHTIKVE